MKNTILLMAALSLLSFSSFSQNLGLDFDGVNDFVRVPPSPSINPTAALTVEFWVKGTTNDGVLLETDQNGGYMFSCSNLGQTTGGPHILFTLGGNVSARLVTTIPIMDGNWHHIAGSFNDATDRLNLYVDGVLNNAGSTGLGQHGNPTPLLIGSRSGGNAFRGQMDEVRVWNVERTPAQIAANMNVSMSGPQAGLGACYNFNNPSATAGGNNAGQTTATDNSGTGNTGTLFNLALNGATSNWVCGAPALGSCTGAAIPTLSEWGLILLSLLSLAVLAAVAFMLSTQRALVPAGTAASAVPAAFVRSMPLNTSLLAKVLMYLLPLAVVGFIAVHYFIGTNGALDFTGTLVSAVIVGYIAHLVAGKKV